MLRNGCLYNCSTSLTRTALGSSTNASGVARGLGQDAGTQVRVKVGSVLIEKRLRRDVVQFLQRQLGQTCFVEHRGVPPRGP